MIFVAALIMVIYTFFGGIILRIIADFFNFEAKWWWPFAAVAVLTLILFGTFGVEAVCPISC